MKNKDLPAMPELDWSKAKIGYCECGEYCTWILYGKCKKCHYADMMLEGE